MKIRPVAILTLWCIFFSQITPVSLAGPRLDQPSSQFPPLTFPSAWGKIGKKDLMFRRGGLLIHIQDAHGDYGVQKNIAKIIGRLARGRRVRSVFLEGGSGRLVPSLAAFFNDKKLSLEMADRLVRRGEMTGAEWALLRLPPSNRPEAFGAENQGLYREDLELFRRVIRLRPETAAFIARLKSSLERRLTDVPSVGVKEFLRQWIRFGDEPGRLLPFLNAAAALAKNRFRLDLSDARCQFRHPNLVRLLKLKKLEKEIGPKQTLMTRRDLFKRLEGQASGNPARGSTPRGMLEGFHAGLKSSNGPRFFDEAFAGPAGFLILRSEIDAADLFREAEVLGSWMLVKILSISGKRESADLMEDLRLLEKLFRLELSRPEYETIMKRRERAAPLAMLRRLGGAEADGEAGLLRVTAAWNDALRFYDTAVEREEAFFQSTGSFLESPERSAVVLISGGFHSSGLEQKAREKGYSYVEIQPRSKRDRSDRETGGLQGDPYLEAMLNGDAPPPAGGPKRGTEIGIVPLMTELQTQETLGWRLNRRRREIQRAMRDLSARSAVRPANPYLQSRRAPRPSLPSAAALGQTDLHFLIEHIRELESKREGRSLYWDALRLILAVARPSQASYLRDTAVSRTFLEALEEKSGAGNLSLDLLRDFLQNIGRIGEIISPDLELRYAPVVRGIVTRVLMKKSLSEYLEAGPTFDWESVRLILAATENAGEIMSLPDDRLKKRVADLGSRGLEEIWNRFLERLLDSEALAYELFLQPLRQAVLLSVAPKLRSLSVLKYPPASREDLAARRLGESWADERVFGKYDAVRAIAVSGISQLVREIFLPYLKDEIYELGSGSGYLRKLFWGKIGPGVHWVATDWNREFLDAESQRKFPEVEHKIARLPAIPEPDGSRRLIAEIAVMDTLPFLSPDRDLSILDRSLEDISRVLRPGGVYVSLLDLEPDLSVEFEAAHDRGETLFPLFTPIGPVVDETETRLRIKSKETDEWRTGFAVVDAAALERALSGMPAAEAAPVRAYLARPEDLTVHYEAREDFDALRRLTEFARARGLIKKTIPALSARYTQRVESAAARAGLEIVSSGPVTRVYLVDRSAVKGIRPDENEVVWWNGHYGYRRGAETAVGKVRVRVTIQVSVFRKPRPQKAGGELSRLLEKDRRLTERLLTQLNRFRQRLPFFKRYFKNRLDEIGGELRAERQAAGFIPERRLRRAQDHVRQMAGWRIPRTEGERLKAFVRQMEAILESRKTLYAVLDGGAPASGPKSNVKTRAASIVARLWRLIDQLPPEQSGLAARLKGIAAEMLAWLETANAPFPVESFAAAARAADSISKAPRVTGTAGAELGRMAEEIRGLLATAAKPSGASLGSQTGAFGESDDSRYGAVIEQFLADYPNYRREAPDENARVLEAMVRSYATPDDAADALDFVRELLIRRHILIRDVPLILRLATADQSLEDLLIHSLLADLAHLFLNHYLERSDLSQFLLPLLEPAAESRSFAMNAVRTAFHLGHSRAEIRRQFLPLAQSGGRRAGVLMRATAALLEQKIIVPEDTEGLIHPLVRLNSGFAEVPEETLAALLRNPRIGKNGFLRFLQPFVTAAGPAADLEGLTGFLSELAASKDWTVREVIGVFVPLLRATGGGSVLGRAVTEAQELGILKPEDVRDLLPPLAGVFGEDALAVLYFGKPTDAGRPESGPDAVFDNPYFRDYARFRGTAPVNRRDFSRRVMMPMARAAFRNIDKALKEMEDAPDASAREDKSLLEGTRQRLAELLRLEDAAWDFAAEGAWRELARTGNPAARRILEHELTLKFESQDGNAPEILSVLKETADEQTLPVLKKLVDWGWPVSSWGAVAEAAIAAGQRSRDLEWPADETAVAKMNSSAEFLASALSWLEDEIRGRSGTEADARASRDEIRKIADDWIGGLLDYPENALELFKRMRAGLLRVSDSYYALHFELEAESPYQKAVDALDDAVDILQRGIDAFDGASSLGGEKPRVSEAALEVARRYAGGTVHFPELAVHEQYRIWKDLRTRSVPDAIPAAGVFHDFNRSVRPFLDYLKTRVPAFRKAGPDLGGQLMILDENLFPEAVRRGVNSPARVAGQIASAFKPNDSLILIWQNAAPRFLDAVHLESRASGLRVRTVRRELGAGTLFSLVRKYSAKRPDPVWVSGGRFAKDPSPGRLRTVKVRLDLKTLSRHGIDPLQVVSLLRQLSDEPSLRKTLFLNAGFVPQGEVWEIGANFIRLLADTIYQQKAALDTVESAARNSLTSFFNSIVTTAINDAINP
jgi:SAM-dependent methyltransferase